MRTAAEFREDLAGRKDRVKELEAQCTPIRGDLARAQEQARKRSESLATAQSEATRLLDEYRAECRRLASGEDSEALDSKMQLQRAEAKVEGLKQLLADNQREVADAQAALAEPSTALASARESETEASVLLQVATGTEAVSDKLRAVMAGADSALKSIPSVDLRAPYRNAVEGQRARLIHLRDHLQRAARFYF